MSKLNPPPQVIPRDLNQENRGFTQNLVRSVYQIFDAIGGGTGIPKIFEVNGTPVSYDPNAPDGFVKINFNNQGKLLPYWGDGDSTPIIGSGGSGSGGVFDGGRRLTGSSFYDGGRRI